MENILWEITSLSGDKETKKAHPWRLCPLGEHYVKADIPCDLKLIILN
jgi:hypothetical protein